MIVLVCCRVLELYRHTEQDSQQTQCKQTALVWHSENCASKSMLSGTLRRSMGVGRGGQEGAVVPTWLVTLIRVLPSLGK